MTKSEIIAEMARVEALFETGEAKGKITVLKSYHRKLAAMYRRAGS